jgi:hypothetical protein
MNLPNYFLADLPSEATLSAGMITEACQTLKHNREHYLAGRPTQRLVRLLSEIGENWLQPDYPFRKLALDRGTVATGFSRPTLVTGLDSFFSQLTGENLHALLEQELGHANRLDEFVATSAEQKSQRTALARGPELLAHITAGRVPNPALTSIVLGILARSAQFVKCARGSAPIPCLFAHSIYEADPKLGACLEIVEWPGGKHDLENALFAEADCVTATGNDETLSAIRQRIPVGTRFLGYGHRVSFGYVTHRALSGLGTRKIVAHAARDIVAWNQLGCLSPHVIYVENGGQNSPEQFAEMLAEELVRREELEPRGILPVEVAAAIASRRAFYEVRAAHSRDTRHWYSQNSTAWSVIFENDPRFQASCLHRFIYIKGVSNLTEALHGADAVRGRLSTVGLAATEDQAGELANQLARWGATRICPLGQMQNPPLTWRHDGRPSLGDLVTWSDWER